MSDASWLCLGFGAVIGALGLPLVLRKVPMNRWYGVRIPQAFESADKWYAINRVGGLWLVGSAGVLLALGVVLAPLEPGPRLDLVLGFLPLAVLLLSAVCSLIHVSRLRL